MSQFEIDWEEYIRQGLSALAAARRAFLLGEIEIDDYDPEHEKRLITHGYDSIARSDEPRGLLALDMRDAPEDDDA